MARALPDRRPVEFAHRDKATWMGWIAVAGGGTGLAFSTWLTRMTELAWPLQTGSMPIVAWWPNMIVMFELTKDTRNASRISPQ